MKFINRKGVTFFYLLTFLWAADLFSQEIKNYPLFVFNNGVEDGHYNTPEKQVKLLKDLGFDGMEKKGIDGFDETLEALKKEGLTLYTMYLNINLDAMEQPYDKRLEEVFQKLAGSQTMPWFYITSKNYPPSSKENDGLAVSILQEIADMANKYDIKIMIYPHINFWVDNVEDAVRVVEKVDRNNVGITFNLCHFLADQGTRYEESFLPLVEKAMPHLFALSLNGADRPTDEIMQQDNLWNHLIQPLGEGDYDVGQYLQEFIKRGFEGPIGLQCFNIKQEKPVHLRKTMAAWKNMQKTLKEGK